MERGVTDDSAFPLPLSLYIIFFPIAIGILGPSFIVADIFFLLFIFACLIKAFIRKQFTIISLDAIFLIFLGCTAFGNNITAHLPAYLFEVASLVYMYAGSRCILSQIDSSEKLNQFIDLIRKVFIIFLLFSAIIIIFRALGFNHITESFFKYGKNYKGFFNFTNQLSIFFACLWPITIIGFSEKPAWRFFFYFIYLVILSYTGSRSGFWIGLGQTTLIEILFCNKKQSAFLVARAFGLAAVLFFVITIMATMPSLNRSLGQNKDASLSLDQPRIINFRNAFNNSKSWLSGYGLGCFDQVYRFEVHSTPLSILVETGICGFLSLSLGIIIFANAFLRASPDRSLPNLKKALIISYLGIIGIGTVNYLFRNRSCWLLFAITLVFIKIQSKEKVLLKTFAKTSGEYKHN
ncbi:MAG: O-antigen ligase family protein [Candidatus Rifleibacteriota bacterium]